MLAIDMLRMRNAAVSTTPWTPSDLATKTAWWRADTGVTLFSGGPSVDSWTAKEGVGSLNTVVSYPQLISAAMNGEPVLEAGAGGRMTLALADTGSDMTVAFVGTLKNAGSAYGRLISMGNLSLAADWNNQSSFNVGRVNLTDSVSVSRNTSGSSAKTVGYDTPFLAVVIFDGIYGHFYVDGTLVNSFPSTGAFNINQIRLWYSVTSGSAADFGRGRMADLILLSRAVSSTEREKTEGYFAHRYGLTGSLPALHPYKSVGPTV